MASAKIKNEARRVKANILDSARRALTGVRRRTIDDLHMEFYYRWRYLGASIPFRIVPLAPARFGYTIEKICAELGLRIVPDETAKLGIYFIAKTFIEPAPECSFPLINKECLDVSKKRVETEFAKVFGYELAVDPTTFVGNVVKKSNANFAHDGVVIDCPIHAPQEGSVYEIAINNIYGDFVEDIRIPVVGRSLPFAYLKYRFIRERFLNNNRRVKRVPIDSVLSDDEQGKILQFAKNMNLDFGELDALRDRDTGRLYVVDVNNTPGGPPYGMFAIQRILAAKALARAFRLEFLS